MRSQPQLQTSTEEIDLLELFSSIWRQRTTVISVTLLAGLIGTGYAFLAPREYQVSSVLRPAAINELDALNRSEIYTLPPAEALNKVGARIDSYDARLSFFKANPELFKAFKKPGQSLEQGFEEFNNNSLSLVLPDPKKVDLSSYIQLNMQYPEDTNGTAILNGLVDHAIGLERAQIAADLKVIINNRLTELQGKIDVARSNYEIDKEWRIAKLLEADKIKRAQLQDELAGLRLQMNKVRANRIAELGEAISIAKSMGIRTPTTPSSMATADSKPNQVMRTEVNNQAIPLYFMGTEALEAERDTLQKRKNDDFTNERVAEIAKELKLLEANREVETMNKRVNEDIFLQNIETLRAEKARLSNLNIDMSTLKLVTIDRRALQPRAPAKPKKALAIALSLAGGLMLGMLAALTRNTIQSRRKAALSKPTHH
ncbi:Wzz/FepE/Etk N-terminal domain-containing protein [Pseudomonas sessilinigenes]|uniref:LPS O-antigen chain length determinant protein WzzB n=1 Tax=Pseudomonas sessilinigenes TaxID=658629 RepID=A0ABX8MZ52_9PSED|nr:Wzz/FepE/Etk N-terminal domain-containing protein [Pseudomonas sessilinigenes]AZC23807.1 regulator of O-antigen component of lipopolysaccharide chain length [Pseudomonas sessilinigenes]QXH43704.1 LPS O-antigen chain length determinant protein WzzB [Pseudomonas sessilinigenes]